ncbi:MAG: hypothetical protein WKI04_10525 [Ferruginibacter sp.]
MQSEMSLLIITAISVAALHTLMGPDHYLPFIALSKSRNWSLGKTMSWTVLCGSGHILGSVLLGLAGAGLGWSISTIGWLDNIRGGIAGWIMLLFGLIYGAWGYSRAIHNKHHKHYDIAGDGSILVYQHQHGEPVMPNEKYRLTPWVMFIIFLLGPCEPMIPLLYAPAAQKSWLGMVMLIGIYTIVTLITMIALVLLGYFGCGNLKTEKLQRWMHPLGGATIFVCGAGMLWMGW